MDSKILLNSQFEVEPPPSRGLVSHAVHKYLNGSNNCENEAETWNYRFDTTLFVISAISSLTYISSIIVAVIFDPTMLATLPDYILMFILSIVLSLDAYIFSGTISRSRDLSLSGKICIGIKSFLIILMCLYFGLTGPHHSVGGYMNWLHNSATVAMFLPSVVTHEFEIHQVALFFGSVDKQSRYNMNGKVHTSDDAKIYDCLMSRRTEFEQVARVSSYSLFVALGTSISICVVYTTLNIRIRNFGGSIPYIAHYILVFSATEGLIRRASTYNDKMSELTRLIRFDSTFLIKILSFEPSGLLLLSFYVSFLSLSVRLLFGNPV
jgi:hypothetical protein